MSPLIGRDSGLEELIPRQPTARDHERIRPRAADVAGLLIGLASLLVVVGLGAAWFGAALL